MSEVDKPLAESVSALLDGEANEMEMHRVLNKVGIERQSQVSIINSKSLRGKWSRYHLASYIMADAPVEFKDISSAVSSAIENERAHSPSSVGKIFDPVARLAIAASVAMLTILGVQQIHFMDLQDLEDVKLAQLDTQADEFNRGPVTQFPADFKPNLQARTVSATQQPMTLVKVNPKREIVRDQQVLSLLSEILEDHVANESSNGIQGMLPFARHIEAGKDIEPE